METTEQQNEIPLPSDTNRKNNKDAIRVAVRVRPFIKREKKLDCKNIITMKDNQTIIKCPKTGQERTFTYDYSYWSHDPSFDNYASQETVYQDLGIGILENAWQGYNCSLFAYGQTGSGKTYTMLGDDENPGIIPRVCEHIFQRIEQNSDPNQTFRVECSMIEIYKEKVRDLLNPKNTNALRVREHPSTGPYVEGLETHVVRNYSQIAKLIEEGNKYKTIARTEMNDYSSRAHTIFEIIFIQEQKCSTKQGKIVTTSKMSKINLIDLAGSERIGKSKSEGERLQEGTAINLSLTTLGLCISKLAEKCTKKKDIFIPYRDSILTWLLKESLGGNSKTVIVAAISPADDNYSESLRAKSITNVAKINEDPKSKLIREMREEIERLRALLANSAMHQELSERYKLQLEESQKIIKQLEMSNEDKERRTYQMLLERQQLLQDAGVSMDEFGNAFRVSANKIPQLVCITSKECILYFIKMGTTYIGSDKECDIYLEGYENDILPEHCIIQNENHTTVTIRTFEGAKCFINGEPIKQETKLHSGDKLQFGDWYIFKFLNPMEQQSEENDLQHVNNPIIQALMISKKREKKEVEMKYEEKITELEQKIQRKNEIIKRMIDLNRRMDNVMKGLFKKLGKADLVSSDEESPRESPRGQTFDPTTMIRTENTNSQLGEQPHETNDESYDSSYDTSTADTFSDDDKPVEKEQPIQPVVELDDVQIEIEREEIKKLKKRIQDLKLELDEATEKLKELERQ